MALIALRYDVHALTADPMHWPERATASLPFQGGFPPELSPLGTHQPRWYRDFVRVACAARSFFDLAAKPARIGRLEAIALGESPEDRVVGGSTPFAHRLRRSVWRRLGRHKDPRCRRPKLKVKQRLFSTGSLPYRPPTAARARSRCISLSASAPHPIRSLPSFHC